MPFSLQRTNVRLTGNIKLVVTENKKYLETIDSTLELSRSVYKGIEYNDDISYTANLTSLTSKLSEKNELYAVPDETSVELANHLSDQYHHIYDYGCYSSISQIVKTSFRCFAPIHITRDDVDLKQLPEAFHIYRLPAVNSDASPNADDALQGTIASDATLVKSFDLSFMTDMMSDMKNSKLRVRFDEGITTGGLDANVGVYTSKQESGIESILANERTLVEFENYVTNSFQRNEMIFSNIMNLEFAFDDADTASDFSRYIGVYVNHNNVDVTTIDSMSELPVFRLVDTEAGLMTYTGDPLSTYYSTAMSSTGLAFGALRAPQIEIAVNFTPKIGERIQIMYNGVNEIDIEMNSNVLGHTISETIDKLIIAINDAAKSAVHITITASKYNGHILIRSNNSNIRYEQISVSLPATLYSIGVKYSANPYQNTFYGSGVNTVILDDFFNPTTFSKMQYISEGVEYTSDIIQVAEYGGNFLYKLSDAVQHANTVDTVWFIQEHIDQPIICSVIDHKTIDFDYRKNYYEDVLDFDPAKYHQYLLNTINSDDYRGRADDVYDSNHPGEPATPAEVTEYKLTIQDMLSNYFDNIILDRKYLINDINSVTYEATTVDNEYERLSEETQPTSNHVNKLYKFINKWIAPNCYDVYQNPYRLNAALPFRYDNFSPSTVSTDRDIRSHTHGWPVIGEGASPYYEVNEANVKHCLSYSKEQITLDMLKDTAVDAYQNLEYVTELKTHASYQTIIYDEDYRACRVMYRGLLLEFADTSLRDYRFAFVLRTDTATEDDVLALRFVRNDAFKTLTLFGQFYIPDPVLTSLEIPGGDYYLDRSLLYFSNEIYATGEDSVDFGESQISLTLYEDTEPKKYLNEIRTNNWYFFDDAGASYVYVKRGDRSRFKSLLSDIIELNEDFTIVFSDTVDTSDPLFGMEITFKNIIEVQAEYFWCSEIEIKYVITSDPGTPSIPEDNTVIEVVTHNVFEAYIEDGPYDGDTIFDKINIFYITSAIAYENCIYRKIVRAKTNIVRYKDISTAAISERLNSSDVITDRVYVNQDIVNETAEYQTCRVMQPVSTSIAIGLTTDSTDQITDLQNKYIYPIQRYNGTYTPLFTDICIWGDTDGLKNVLYNTMLDDNRYRLNIGKLSSDTNLYADYYTESYNRDLLRSDFYSSISASVNDELSHTDHAWLANPAEFRGYMSIVLNTLSVISASISVESTNGTLITRRVLIADVFRASVAQFCNFNRFKLTAAETLSILKLYTDATADTMSNYDFEQIITDQFIERTLLTIYRITSVVNSAGSRIQYDYDDKYIYLQNVQNETLTVTITRN